MGHSICFLGLIILLKILRPFECNNLEVKALPTQPSNSTASDLKSDNRTMRNTLKLDSSFTTSTKRSTSSENNTSVSETSTMDTIESTDEGEDQQILIILEKSNRNSVLEPWYRVKRDGEDKEYQKSSNSDGDNTFDKNNDNNSTSEENNDNTSGENDDTADEETDDSSSKSSKEESYSQFDPESEVDSMDVKGREKKSTYSQESEEEGRLYPAWYQPSFSNRYWSSDEKGSSRHFIRIPVFPGK
ncbi:mitochondrial intermembrane space import and assembly protein 40-like [Frieseomelitta varia]|uniref:mitochondrial intermembrane space import and assembly protein 40-like n=1 Tax=Frieseomelitta varia TaxID=561572 RepID=UPI001CB6A087|nr:mitochondrial intermembrane space import and assembly protein 40-like [Frieseomelitta varia]